MLDAEIRTVLRIVDVLHNLEQGAFRVKRKTSKRKLKQKIQEFKVWIKENRNLPLANIMTTVKRKLIGHYNYYGITDNTNSMKI